MLDNLVVHKASRVEQRLLGHGWQLVFLPAYGPDRSPIEQAFSKIKQVLRILRSQTVEALIDAIVQALNRISPLEAGFLNLD